MYWGGGTCLIVVVAICYYVVSTGLHRTPSAAVASPSLKAIVASEDRDQRLISLFIDPSARTDFENIIREIARSGEVDRREALGIVCALLSQLSEAGDTTARERLHEVWGVFRRDIPIDRAEEIARLLSKGTADSIAEDAFRVLAEAARTRGDVGVSEQMLRERLVVARALSSENASAFGGRLILAEYDLSSLLAGVGRWQEAQDVLQQPPSAESCRSNPATAIGWYQQKSLLAEKTGNRRDAARWLRLLVTEVPELAASQTKKSSILSSAIELEFDDRSPEKATAFLGLWNQFKGIGGTAAISIGNNAAILLATHRRSETFAVLVDLDAEFERSWGSLSDVDKGRWERQRVSTRLKLVDEMLLRGERTSAFDLLVDIANKFPSVSDTSRFKDLVDRAGR